MFDVVQEFEPAKCEQCGIEDAETQFCNQAVCGDCNKDLSMLASQDYSGIMAEHPKCDICCEPAIATFGLLVLCEDCNERLKADNRAAFAEPNWREVHDMVCR